MHPLCSVNSNKYYNRVWSKFDLILVFPLVWTQSWPENFPGYVRTRRGYLPHWSFAHSNSSTPSNCFGCKFSHGICSLFSSTRTEKTNSVADGNLHAGLSFGEPLTSESEFVPKLDLTLKATFRVTLRKRIRRFFYFYCSTVFYNDTDRNFLPLVGKIIRN